MTAQIMLACGAVLTAAGLLGSLAQRSSGSNWAGVLLLVGSALLLTTLLLFLGAVIVA